MNRRNKIIIILIVVAVPIGIGFGFVFDQFRKNVKQETTITNSEDRVEKKLPSASLLEYTDSSGFSFQHPEDIQVEPQKSDDKSVYTDIKLTVPGINGHLNIRVTDSAILLVEEFFLEQNIATESVRSEVLLGGLSAVERRLQTSITTAALDKKVLFTIEVLFADQPDYWINVYNTVLSSFSFVQQASESNSSDVSAPSESDVVFEGEEVIE